MSEALLLYAFTRVDVLVKLSVAVLMLSGMGGLLAAIMTIVENGSSVEGIRALRWFKTLRNVAIASLAVIAIVPTQRDLAVIIGGTMAIHATKSDTAKKVFDLANSVLDEELAKRAKSK